MIARMPKKSAVDARTEALARLYLIRSEAGKAVETGERMLRDMREFADQIDAEMKDDRMVSTAQAAAECGVSTKTILRMIRAGALRAESTPGGHYRIMLCHAREALRRRATPPPLATPDTIRDEVRAMFRRGRDGKR